MMMMMMMMMMMGMGEGSHPQHIACMITDSSLVAPAPLAAAVAAAAASACWELGAIHEAGNRFVQEVNDQ